MPTLQMLDVAIGMTFTFLLISLICTACNELLESWLKYRAKYLEQGIRELLGAPTAGQASKQAKTKNSAANNADKPSADKPGADKPSADRSLDYATRLYQHPLVNSLFTGSYKPASRSLPSYVPARTFALAIMDVLVPATTTTESGTQNSAPIADNVGNVAESPATRTALPLPTPGSLAAFRTSVAKLPDTKLRAAILALTDAAGDDMAAVRTNLENWYNSSMDRVAGWYKRRAQITTLVLGLAIAGFLNADAIALFKSLVNNRALRDSLVAAATAQAQAGMPTASLDTTLTRLEDLKLPIGWYGDWPPEPAAPQAPRAKAKPAAAALKATSQSGSTQADTASARKPPAATAQTGAAVQQAAPKTSQQPGTSQAAPPPPKSPGADVAAWQQANRKLALPTTRADWLLKILGLLITGVAVSLGAPFWFDVLNKFVVVRSTVKPHEKSPEEASDDRQKAK